MPLTTSVDRLYPSEALVILKGRRNKAMADQITTVSKLRLMDRMGRFFEMNMERVEHAVMVRLGLFEPIEGS